jgi:hypothetical protein
MAGGGVVIALGMGSTLAGPELLVSGAFCDGCNRQARERAEALAITGIVLETSGILAIVMGSLLVSEGRRERHAPP